MRAHIDKVLSGALVWVGWVKRKLEHLILDLADPVEVLGVTARCKRTN